MFWYSIVPIIKEDYDGSKRVTSTTCKREGDKNEAHPKPIGEKPIRKEVSKFYDHHIDYFVSSTYVYHSCFINNDYRLLHG